MIVMKNNDPSTWADLELADETETQKLELLQELSELLIEHDSNFSVKLESDSETGPDIKVIILWDEEAWGEITILVSKEEELIYSITCYDLDLDKTFEYADDALEFIVENID